MEGAGTWVCAAFGEDGPTLWRAWGRASRVRDKDGLREGAGALAAGVETEIIARCDGAMRVAFRRGSGDSPDGDGGNAEDAAMAGPGVPLGEGSASRPTGSGPVFHVWVIPNSILANRVDASILTRQFTNQ